MTQRSSAAVLGRLTRATLVTMVVMFVALVVAGWWFQPAAVFLGRRGDHWDAVDFSTLYSAADRVAEGQPQSVYYPERLEETQRSIVPAHFRADAPLSFVNAGQALAFLNPPWFAGALAPLALLDPESALQVWLSLQLGFVVLAAILTWRAMAGASLAWRIGMLAFLLSAYPLTFALRLGQFSPMLMASWCAAYTLLKAGRDRWAGVALAPLLIKPELLIPVTLVLLYKRRTTPLQTLFPITGVLIVLSFVVVGLEEGVRYPQFVLENAANDDHGTNAYLMFGWNGILAAVGGESRPHVATLSAIGPSLLTLVALLWALRGEAFGSERFPEQWLLLTLATLLVDPNLFLQDTAILLPAALVVAVRIPAAHRNKVLLALLAGWTILALGVAPGQALHVSVFALLMAGAFAYLVASALGARRALTISTLTQSPEPLASAAAAGQ